MKKLPILITYIHTHDNGRELRYALRSLSNIKNFSGAVTIVGDREAWFYNINHLPIKRIFGKPYHDQHIKIKHALQFMPEEFILGQDDIYATTKIEVGAYYIGELNPTTNTLHQRTKQYTKEKLLSMGLPILDYEAHAFMKVERDKLSETIDVILADEQKQNLQIRSLYGNMHQPKSEYFEDKKTKTSKLREGAIISTQMYTPELETLLPNPSIFEQRGV